MRQELTRLNGRPTVTVRSQDRPVPLEFAYSEIPLAQTLERLAAEGKAPVYVVHFTQAEAAQSAQDFTSINVATREEKNRIANEIEGFRFSSPYGPEIRKWLKHGIAIHHAGLLPKYRVLVEQLAQKGLLKIICGTDTLGVGINVPIRTVLFTRLCKFDGQKTGILSARDFHQISGRAGRKGFDDKGWVVAQAPEHVVENLKLEEKAARDGRKFVKRRPPDHNFVNWDKNTFQRLIVASPERLSSRFQVSHGMLLNVLSREGDGCRAMQRLIHDCHETPKQKKEHLRRAWQLFRSLLDRKIIEILPPCPEVAPSSDHREGPADASAEERGGRTAGVPCSATSPNTPTGVADTSVGDEASAAEPAAGPPPAAREPRALPKLRVNVELQDDFSMDQALSLYLIETLPLVNPEQPDYALVLLTLVESILEDPEIILRRQLDKLKGQKVAEMKAAGMGYDERMEELEKLEHPKPNREFIYSTFNAFADRHPWVGQENIRPKSIAREMFENFRSFGDYIRDYELQRSEGLLLRHLNSVYKVLAQTVPDAAKNDTAREMELYLQTLLRQVDSSLLDEWAKMRNPDYETRIAAERARTAGVDLRPPGAEEAAADITRDTKAFTAAIRNRVFTFLRGLVIGDFEAARGVLADMEPRGDAAGNEAAGRRNGESATDAAVAVSAARPLGDSEGNAWTPGRLEQAMDAYLAEHDRLCLDPEARNIRHTYVTPSEDTHFWRVQQMLVDPDGHNDWVAEFEVDLAASRAAREPVLRFVKLGSLV